MSDDKAGILYLVATPIGNLGDISARALATLRQVSAVVCEDTRVTAKLLQHYDIKQLTLSFHHHSSEAVSGALIVRLKAGESLAYVSDAGTPGIADPGGKLVAAAANAGVRVIPIPGPSAVTTALSVAGLPTQRYLFLGFPPHKKGRQTFFKEVAFCPYAVVFYESTHRITKTLTGLAKLIPLRQLVVGRELTKHFETIYRGTSGAVLEQLVHTSTKGEFVIIVAPSK
ncbi:MAG: 16S rRNA (cytidine(1402)-2'-O)-methyltransferase [Candidatus Kerfeldbacteria bacterium]|nr:16S rRNA (cytidine(1402)-2'-O)-methyltransferase [Candidatus Kerfeldbacteria bacterium]